MFLYWQIRLAAHKGINADAFDFAETGASSSWSQRNYTVPSKELCLERRHKFLFIKRLKIYLLIKIYRMPHLFSLVHTSKTVWHPSHMYLRVIVYTQCFPNDCILREAVRVCFPTNTLREGRGGYHACGPRLLLCLGIVGLVLAATAGHTGVCKIKINHINSVILAKNNYRVNKNYFQA